MAKPSGQVDGSLPRSHSLVSRVTGNHVGPSRGSSNLPLGAFQSSINKAEGSLNQTRTGHYSALQPFSSSVQIDLEAPPEEISPLQLIAKASSAALELAKAGMNEAAIELLESLAETWK